MPSWVQAVGSVAAIVGAGYGVKAQLKHTENKAINDLAADQRNVIISLIAELTVYSAALEDINEKVWQTPSAVFGKMLQLIFPSASFRFPIYVANAAKIWAVSDDHVRGKLIGVYAELDMLFALLDRNSAIAQLIPHNETPSAEVAAQLKGLFPVIKAQLDKLIPEVQTVKAKLEEQVFTQ